MEPIDRRRALQLGALGALGAVVGGVGISRTGLPWSRESGATPPRSQAEGDPPETSPPASSTDSLEPEELRSAKGLLRVELEVSPARVEIGGRQVNVLAYNGALPGPTWRVHPGDRIEVRLVNRLDAPTNLHTHGLVVSPRGNSDNPFLTIEPGESFDYRFDLPSDHPTGPFWYHPHLHGTVADQVFGGLYGAIIVEPAEESIPVGRERTLIVSDISFTDAGEIRQVTPPEIMMGREGEVVLVNGRHQPQMTARAGERERWRIVNACTSRYLRLDLPGQELRVLGVDSGHEPGSQTGDGLVLAPGNRADLAVTMSAGTSELATLGYDRGHAMMGMRRHSGSQSGAVKLATLTVSGQGAESYDPVPPREPGPDLREREVTRRREIAFTMAMGPMMRGGGRMHEGMGFDGLPFEAGRIDQQVRAGAVEEWTINNPTPMDHPFHLHVWPMQVIEQSGTPVDRPTWRDVVNVPAHGHVKVLIDFSHHDGLTVYHCHILDHEDAGMMATVEVTDST